MISVHSPWLAAHGKLWYDDKWYRMAWIMWPQALAAVLVLWFWAMPPASKTAQWGVPLDNNTRYQQLLALRDSAKADRAAMGTLEANARGGDMNAQFFMATLYDPDLKLSTIVSPNFDLAADWYSKAAGQGHQMALNNLALSYAQGTFTRLDYSRACYYALKITSDGPGNGLNVKGDCYARGLGGTKADPMQAEAAYKAAAAKGAVRTSQPSGPAAPTPPALNPPALDPPAFKPAPLNNFVPNPPPLNPPDNSTAVQWGAMAFTADGSYSTIWKMASQAEAEADVAKRCSAFGRGACKVLSFSGQECAALATFIGSYARRRWQLSYTAGGATYPEAQNNALGRCNADERSRGRCQSRTAACADGR
jgi:TPR repeat protein